MGDSEDALAAALATKRPKAPLTEKEQETRKDSTPAPAQKRTIAEAFETTEMEKAKRLKRTERFGSAAVEAPAEAKAAEGIILATATVLPPEPEASNGKEASSGSDANGKEASS